MIQILAIYFRQRWVWMLLIGYFMLSVMLYIIWDIHILLPCLWKSIFGFPCPGCGLTTAFIALVQLKWHVAWSANPLIYPVLPAVFYFIGYDFRKFYRTLAK